jgi:hypothetical protein
MIPAVLSCGALAWSAAAVAYVGSPSRAAPPSMALHPLEAATLFARLADDYILLDPSGGTCCRSGCSSCSWMDEETGEFLAEERRAELDGVAMWMAPYTLSEVGEGKSHAARWAATLFGESSTVTRAEFDAKLGVPSAASRTVLDGADAVEVPAGATPSTAALDALWTALAANAPTLSADGTASAARALHKKGVTLGDFRKQVAATAELIEEKGLPAVVDYDAMDTADLKALVKERKLKMVPPMRRMIIEDLRFYDMHGRQGKRHPATKKLS